MNGIRKYIRLLPAVVIVGICLLAIKGADLARAAQAPAGNSDTPDNSGLAPSDGGSLRPANDFAADDGTIASAAEVDVLTSLTRRRSQLDARERALNMRENLLGAGEGRVDQKIAALKALQTQIQGLLTQRDAAQELQIALLVKTYSTMKPKDAARIFNSLSDEVLIPVAKGMKSDILAPVLAAMNPDAAQKLTVKLATLLKLPEAPPAADCPTLAALAPMPDATAPTPGTSAAITPPLQTAALTPPSAAVQPVVTLTPPATTPPAPPPAPPAATPPQAAAVPPPHMPAPHKPAKPATAAAHPPTKPTTASATAPAKPAPTPTIAPPAKPATASTTPPAAVNQAAVTPPAAPPGATPLSSGPPAAITPPPNTGG